MSYCCVNCFEDKFLEKQIINASLKRGNCDFCESKDVNLVEAKELQDFFEAIFEIYEIDENNDGIYLSEIINLDWKIFKDGLHKYILNQMLSEILDKEEIKTRKYKNCLEKISGDVWEKFKFELKYKNRYFPDSEIFNINRLYDTLQCFALTDYSEYVYRARISKDGEIIPNEKMGRPPEGNSSQGRANPIGISYLYVASEISTAISEIRPHKGDTVTVVKIKLPSSFRLLDIRNPKNTVSPFEYSDNALETLYKDLDLLERFGEELSRPVLPREANIEYVPSQYLTEFIKRSGFQGLLYKSSVGMGYNVVIFEEFELNIVNSYSYIIKDLQFTFE